MIEQAHAGRGEGLGRFALDWSLPASAAPAMHTTHTTYTRMFLLHLRQEGKLGWTVGARQAAGETMILFRASAGVGVGDTAASTRAPMVEGFGLCRRWGRR